MSRRAGPARFPVSTERAAARAHSACACLLYTSLPVDKLERDEALRPQAWLARQVQLRLSPDRPLVFNTEWVADPFSVQLRAGDSLVTVTRDAAGRYDIR